MSKIIPIPWVAFLLFFMAGAAFGSFCNVVADRVVRGESVVTGRSHCENCGHVLGPLDLIPIVSYIALGGKCRYCRAKLSLWYFLSEITVGIMFAAALLKWGITGDLPLAGYNIILYLMIYTCASMDIKSGLVSDGVVAVFSAIGLIWRLIFGYALKNALMGAAAGFALYFAIYTAAKLILKNEGFGQGDVVLMTGIGSFFTPTQALITGILAFYLCLAVIAVLKAVKINVEQTVPFCPAMCAAAFIMSLWKEPVISRLMGIMSPVI